MRAALTVMVDNSIAGITLDARTALELGVVDAVESDPMTAALVYVDRNPRGVDRPIALEPDSDDSVIDEVMNRARKRVANPLDALTHLERIVRHASSLTETELFEAEDAALADLSLSAEFRRRLYAFRVSSGATKLPAGAPDVAPRPIARVGVVGAGLMASQIALVFSEKLGVPVRYADVSPERLDAAHERIAGWLRSRLDKGSIDSVERDDILARLHPTLDLDDFSDCDLVIEAVFEDLSVKKDVLERLDGIVADTAILASNTSSLSINDMAEFLRDPGRLTGIHFFNPVGVLKLVEVVRAPRESDVALATAIDVSRRLGKTPVLVADESGFVVNRILSVFLGEALRLCADGVSPDRITAALAPLRLPLSPFALIDLIGRTVTLKMLESLERFASERFFVGDELPRLIDVDGELSTLLAEGTSSNDDRSDVDIHDHVVDSLAREVRIMLNGGVVDNARAIDLCMMNGAAWPAAIGGLTPYLDGCGASQRAGDGLFHPTLAFD